MISAGKALAPRVLQCAASLDMQMGIFKKSDEMGIFKESEIKQTMNLYHQMAIFKESDDTNSLCVLFIFIESTSDSTVL